MLCAVHTVLRAASLRSAQWHDMIGDPTMADALLDRIIHNAHRIALEGDSIRKKGAASPLTSAEDSETNPT
ncbi:ATP-binding protein [Bradyrhizobium altum]|uniref:ATP-binding protein n=1 Tax=Bradyrhizobium altum TaxID=1571202 RepID=UPI0035DB03DE